ncbi:hypothetical protein OCK74_22850 [Chitinophagaceae bacterium LB-8]|uniref:Uncharacterized protein n=1 Tax=Paraflavisolibacter caeni TaxID=2982496 RepID=A0A9X3BIV0_9BACT|nr:hypothetical protein [Paraflavisolibacter caeni]MCU7551977.1 hypothetical protein [Paraflavisolibacter caeni]
MIPEFPVEFQLSNGTHVLVRKTNAMFEFHLTRRNGMKHNFNWTDAEGITDAETATALPRESFAHEESEAITILQEMRQ